MYTTHSEVSHGFLLLLKLTPAAIEVAKQHTIEQLLHLILESIQWQTLCYLRFILIYNICDHFI